MDEAQTVEQERSGLERLKVHLVTEGILRPLEFDGMTLREVNAYYDAWSERERAKSEYDKIKIEAYQEAIAALMACITNASGRYRKQFTADDFIEKKAKKVKQTPQEVEAILRGFFGASSKKK